MVTPLQAMEIDVHQLTKNDWIFLATGQYSSALYRVYDIEASTAAPDHYRILLCGTTMVNPPTFCGTSRVVIFRPLRGSSAPPPHPVVSPNRPLSPYRPRSPAMLPQFELPPATEQEQEQEEGGRGATYSYSSSYQPQIRQKTE